MNPLQEILAKIKPKRLSEQEQDLANGLVENTWNTDKEIIDHYWPNNPHGPVYLSSLKSRLISKLTSSILFFKSDSTYQSTYIDCWREFAAIQVLKGIGLRKGAVWMAERLLKKAMQYNLTSIVVLNSEMLEMNFGHLTGDRNKWMKYKKINETYEAIQRSEKDARTKLLEVSVNFSASRSVNKELALKAEEYSVELQKNLNNIDSLHYGLYTYNLMILHAELTQNPSQLLTTCQEALAHFNKKPYPIPESANFMFNFKMIHALLITRDFEACYTAIQRSKAIAKKGYNFGVCLIYEVIFGFHCNDEDTIKRAIHESHKYRKFAVIDEQWKIMEAYANFFDIKTGQRFRVSKFLNEVPIFAKDKEGNNISILALQILFYLKARKKGKIIDRAEALKQYAKRYLRKDNSYRSNCFVHMLLSIVKGNFHPAAVTRYATPYIKRLEEYRGGEVEIVPYERLWEEVIRLLENPVDTKSV